MKRLLYLCVMALLVATTAAAQQMAKPLMATVVEAAPIYVEMKVQRIPLRTAAPGTHLEVLGEEGEWVRVRFQDPQYGQRFGYVMSKLLRIEYPELQPTDLSVDKPVPPPLPPQAPARAPAAAPAPTPASTYVEGFPNRRGFMIGFGFGGGAATACYIGCGTEGAALFELHLGGMIGPNTALMYDTSGLGIPVDGETFSLGFHTLAVQQYSGKGWFKVGGGFASGTCVSCFDSAFGFSLMSAGGYEMVQHRSFVLDLQGRFLYSRLEGVNIFAPVVSLGFNWY